jgi:hypothetical protein
MRFILISFLVSSSFILQAQLKSELSVNAVKGFFMQNNLYFTNYNYEDFNPTSGVNLKCNSSAGLQFNFQDFIAKSKWYYLASYDRRWLKYSTILYSWNYNPNTVFNHVKQFSYQNQTESFSLGFGRRLNLKNEQLTFDINVGLSYRTFDDYQIGTEDPQSPLISTISVGDFLYDVSLDYSKLSKWTLNAQSNFKYHLNNQMAINLILSISGKISGEYNMDVTTRDFDEVLPEITLLHYKQDPYIWLGSIVTNYLNVGLGLTYKF